MKRRGTFALMLAALMLVISACGTKTETSSPASGTQADAAD